MSVQILGIKEAQAYLRKLQGGARAVGTASVRVGSNLRYAWGNEFGRHKGGRLARRAGGSFALTGGFRSVQPRIRPAIVAALPQGPEAVMKALMRLAYDVVAATQPRTPVKSGTLRRSWHVVAQSGGSFRQPVGV